jgi:hypothetical protein
MNEAIDDRFVEIIEHAISEAERVPCSLTEFYLGLRMMKMVLDAHLEAEASEVNGTPVDLRRGDLFG